MDTHFCMLAEIAQPTLLSTTSFTIGALLVLMPWTILPHLLSRLYPALHHLMFKCATRQNVWILDEGAHARNLIMETWLKDDLVAGAAQDLRQLQRFSSLPLLGAYFDLLLPFHVALLCDAVRQVHVNFVFNYR